MDQEHLAGRNRLLEQLLAAEEDRAAGRMGCTLEELERFLEEALERV